jgi:hypothetical protein
VVLELGEELLCLIEVGRIFGEEQEPSAGRPDGLVNAPDHDIAGLERRDEQLLDIEQETLAVDGTMELPGCLDPVSSDGSGSVRRQPAPIGSVALEFIPYSVIAMTGPVTAPARFRDSPISSGNPIDAPSD